MSSDDAEQEGELRIDRRRQLCEGGRERTPRVREGKGDDDIAESGVEHGVDFWEKGPRTPAHNVTPLRGEEPHAREGRRAHSKYKQGALLPRLAQRLPISGG